MGENNWFASLAILKHFIVIWNKSRSVHSYLLCAAEVQVLITVTLVNEFDPRVVSPLVLLVPEDSQRGAVVAVVQAVDQDWPFHFTRLSIAGGHTLFSIDPIGGETGFKR